MAVVVFSSIVDNIFTTINYSLSTVFDCPYFIHLQMALEAIKRHIRKGRSMGGGQKNRRRHLGCPWMDMAW